MLHYYNVKSNKDASANAKSHSNLDHCHSKIHYQELPVLKGTWIPCMLLTNYCVVIMQLLKLAGRFRMALE